MRIDELRFLAFGPFTGRSLDLRNGKQGFHLIYGPNEAGKSSALRAVRYLLYGIPERSSDDFLHPYSKMRIGATLRSADNKVLEIVRRKGRLNTLRTADESVIVAESTLQSLLGKVDAELFSMMFGLGYEDLVQGGQEIVRGGGDLGRLLFAAGSGIVNLQKIQADLQMAADALFKPAGKKPLINLLLQRLGHSRKALSAAQLPAKDWDGHHRALKKAVQRKHRVDLALAGKRKALHRLRRINEALPLIAKRRELAEELQNYLAAILLPEDFPEIRRRHLTQLKVAEKVKEQAQKNENELQQQIAHLPVTPHLLEQAVMVEELYRALGSQLKAAQDRVTLLTRRDTLREEAKEVLSNISGSLPMEEVERLRIKKAQRVKIRTLGAQYERIITRIDDAHLKQQELAHEIHQIENELQALPTPRVIEELMLCVEAAKDVSPLEKSNQLEQAEIQTVLATIAQEQNKLGLGELESPAVEVLPVPYVDTIRVFEDRLATLERQLSEVEGELRRHRRALDELKRQLDACQLAQSVPTETDLFDERGLRDRGWLMIVQKLQSEPIAEEDLQDYLATATGADTLAEAFESHMRQADLISDRLRREADRVAAQAKLATDRAACQRQLQALEQERHILDSKITQTQSKWCGIWPDAIKNPRTPKEMSRWTQDFEGLIQKIKAVREQQTKVDQLAGEIEGHRLKLIQQIKPPETGENGKAPSLRQLLRQAQGIIKKEQAHALERRQMERELLIKKDQAASLQSQLDANNRKLEQWGARWEKALRPLGLKTDALPSEATAVMDEISRLFAKLKEADILHRRIEGIDRDAEGFADQVNRLVEVVAPDLSAGPAEEAVIKLYQGLKTGRDAHAKEHTLQKQLQQEQKRLKTADQDILHHQAQLRHMCDEAGCENYQDLSEAEQRSDKRRQLEADLEMIDERLRQLSGGLAVEDFISEAAGVDPDGMAGDMRQLEEVIQELGQKKSELDQTIGRQRNELDKMDGSPLAAEMAEEIQRLLARLAGSAEQYARLKVAAKVLSLAVERYRSKYQGPLLGQASLLFQKMTGGSFEGLRAEFDDRGRPVIMGVRPGQGEIVGVSGMSDGTADQLFLALRLAGLQMYIEKNESMPFILDDILIKFDNERAATALQTLADVSAQTQLIFFTHHQHLVDLAQTHIDPAVLTCHRL